MCGINCGHFTGTLTIKRADALHFVVDLLVIVLAEPVDVLIDV
ncbi:hypothetical protein JMUB7504_27480 [Staphylococcus aureus]